MPPKPSSSTSSKETDEAVLAVSEKLGNLQSQLTDLEQLQNAHHESLLTMMQNLLEQVSTFTSPPHTTQPVLIPPPTIHEPPPTGPQRSSPCPQPTPSVVPMSLPQPAHIPQTAHIHTIPIHSPHHREFPFPDSNSGSVPPFFPPFPHYSQNFPPHLTPNNIPPIQPAKIQLLPFEGSEPLDWLFQADQFFMFYQIPMEQRLPMAAFYMKGEALSWFKWMFQNGQLPDWLSFVRALELRFGPSSYDNYQAELFKLRQNGSVSDYQSQFEKLCNRIYGLPPDALLNCFLSGLYPDIRKELAILKPSTLSQALGLAKLVEAKIKDSRPKSFRNPPTPITTPHNNALQPHPTHTVPSTHNNLPIRKLNPTQLQERRAQGLCYNCDEKFVPGHKCASPKFLLLLSEDVDLMDDSTGQLVESADTDQGPLHFQLSPHAITRQISPKTLKFKGLVFGLQVSILVDTGSTHNIIQPRIAKYLQLPFSPIKSFTVMVGNGEHLTCDKFCRAIPLRIQEQMFAIPCYILPIEGADIVLGLDWLSTLGEVSANFATPSLTFNYHNIPINLSYALPTVLLAAHRNQRVLHSYINSTRNATATIFRSEEINHTKYSKGVEVIAAWSPNDPISGVKGDRRKVEYNAISGTSMTCPHATAPAAYIKSFHPSWSPAMIKSALMTTGLINPVKATNPGLVYDISEADYIKFLCGEGYTDKELRVLTEDHSTCKGQASKRAVCELNLPSFALSTNGSDFTRAYHRTVTNVGSATSTYKARVIAPSLLRIQVKPSTLTFTSIGQKKSFYVIIEGKINVETVSASLIWDDGSHKVRSPIVVYENVPDN